MMIAMMMMMLLGDFKNPVIIIYYATKFISRIHYFVQEKEAAIALESNDNEEYSAKKLWIYRKITCKKIRLLLMMSV